jgi:hypothetical protein
MSQSEQRHFARKYFVEELLRLASTRKNRQAKRTNAMTRRPTIAARHRGCGTTGRRDNQVGVGKSARVARKLQIDAASEKAGAYPGGKPGERNASRGTMPNLRRVLRGGTLERAGSMPSVVLEKRSRGESEYWRLQWCCGSTAAAMLRLHIRFFLIRHHIGQRRTRCQYVKIA